MKLALQLSFILFVTTSPLYADVFSSSAFDTQGAPLPQSINTNGEKTILVDPANHFYGAYGKNGHLIRWGIATTGANDCKDSDKSCRTQTGHYRIYSLGNEHCVSSKYPYPTGGAPMPYCMFFVNGQAIHGSDDVQSANASHGCVRVHVSDAKWLRYQFVEAPSPSNHYQGTLVMIKNYS